MWRLLKNTWQAGKGWMAVRKAPVAVALAALLVGSVLGAGLGGGR